MNLSEVAKLIGVITAYDLRVEVSELKIRAWHESLDEDLNYDDGRKIVHWYYANYDAVISPSAINREWRRRKRDEAERESTRFFFEELEQHKANKASPESVQKYLDEIRSKLGQKNASVEPNRGQVAPDL